MDDPRDMLGRAMTAVTSRVIPNVPMSVDFADARIDNVRWVAEHLPSQVPFIPCGCPHKKQATVRELCSELLQASGRDPETEMPEWVIAGEQQARLLEAQQREAWERSKTQSAAALATARERIAALREQLTAQIAGRQT